MPGGASHDPPPPRPSLEESVARLETQLNALKVQVRQAQQLSVLGLTAATLAHEFNNLLTPVLSYAQYALEHDDPTLTHKALEVTVKNVRVLKAMAERLLHIAAAKSAATEAIRVRASLRDALDAHCRDLDKDGVTLREHVPEDLACLADPLHLQQVFFNLLLNAREALAGNRHGCIRIDTDLQNGQVLIRISDNGRGIAPEDLPHVFDPLRSTKTVRADGQYRCGGLGLPLCRDLLAESGGSIDVESTLGEGTTFTIRLPAADAHD